MGISQRGSVVGAQRRADGLRSPGPRRIVHQPSQVFTRISPIDRSQQQPQLVKRLLIARIERKQLAKRRLGLVPFQAGDLLPYQLAQTPHIELAVLRCAI